MSFTMITVSATYDNGDGTTPAVGFATFTLSEPIQDSVSKIVPPTRYPVAFDGTGSFSVEIPAVDDPTTEPTGVFYYAVIEIEGARTSNIRIAPSHTAPGGAINLATVAPAIPSDAAFGYALESYVNTQDAAVLAAAEAYTNSHSSAVTVTDNHDGTAAITV